jgi:hypothetical protein
LNRAASNWREREPSRAEREYPRTSLRFSPSVAGGIAPIRATLLAVEETSSGSAELVAHSKQLDLPISWSGINPDFVPHFGCNGRIDNVGILFPCDTVPQQLRYTEIAGH